MTTQPTASTTETAAANAAELTPAAAWSRRVRRIGGFIQTAFAALWLVRASLTIGGAYVQLQGTGNAQLYTNT